MGEFQKPAKHLMQFMLMSGDGGAGSIFQAATNWNAAESTAPGDVIFGD